jgi:SSS family solute:Na+ symporter
MLATFTGYDWLIVVAYIVIGTLPGFLLRKYIRGQAEFLVAGRSLSIFLATATLTATELGLITVMYFAQAGFLQGFSAFTIGLIALICTLFVGLTGFLVAGFRASGVTTFAEYYEKRYSRGVRLLGGLILAAAGILNYGVFLRIEAEFVRILTNIPDMVLRSQETGPGAWSVAIPSLRFAMVVLVLLVLGYTLLGGMVSVVVTDYIQFIVLTLGMGVTTWLVLTDHTTGGFAGLVDAVQKTRAGYGMHPLETVSKGRLLFGLGGIFVAWQVLHWTASSCWQTSAFRTAAADSTKTARVMWSLTAINYFGRAIVPMLWGVAALAFFFHRGDDLAKMDSLQAMPSYLATMLPAGVSGLLLAGMLAAMMSTHSGYLLSWSGVLTEDLLSPVLRTFGISLGDRTRLWITRFFILCLAAYLLYFGLWYEVKSNVWNFLALTGTMYFAGAATLLAFGLYWKRANVGGAFAGLICGAAPGLFAIITYIIALSVEREITNPGHVPVGLAARISDHLSEPVVGLISYPLGIVAMIVGSLVYERLRSGSAVETTVAPAPGDTPLPNLSANAGPEDTQ